MDITQIGFGIVLVGVGTLTVVGRSVTDSDPFLYFLTAGALVLSAFAVAICVLRERRGPADRRRQGV